MGPETRNEPHTVYAYDKGTGDTFTISCLETVNLDPKTTTESKLTQKDFDDIFENIKRMEMERRKSMYPSYAVQVTKEEVEALAKMRGESQITAVEIESISYDCDYGCRYECVKMTGHIVRVDLAPDIFKNYSFPVIDPMIRKALTESQEAFYLYKKRIEESFGQAQKPKNMFPGYSAFEPKKIIKNGPAVIVYWKDGSKTIVMKKPDDPDDIYSAFAQALLKRFAGSTTHAHKSIDKMVENH